MVKADQIIPCDLLLLYSNSVDKSCHIKTANLDGETNLKLRRVPHFLPDNLTNEQELEKFRAAIYCEIPNASLYKFEGNMELNGYQKYNTQIFNSIIYNMHKK